MNEKVSVVSIEGIVKRSAKTTRYLVKMNEEYYTILEKSGLYEIGELASVNDSELMPNPKKSWLSRRANYNFDYAKVIDHLSNYKRNRLNIIERGTFRGQQYDHVLQHREDNLIKGCEQVEESYQAIKNAGELHGGFCNLNSSQAFAINFFAPLMEAGEMDSVFKTKRILKKECSFEKILSKKERTQFDFYVEKSVAHPAISIEVKYTESDFGIASIDAEHIRKYEEQYSSQMAELVDSNVKMSEFFEQYQLWRNLLYVLDGQVVCFMFPSFRTDLKKKVERAKELCKKELQNNIKIILADDIVNNYIDGKNKMLSEVFTEFKLKYLDIK